MIAVSIILIATFGLLCSLAVHRARQIRNRRLAEEWEHPDWQWPKRVD